jgi:hypothetical protein
MDRGYEASIWRKFPIGISRRRYKCIMDLDLKNCISVICIGWTGMGAVAVHLVIRSDTYLFGIKMKVTYSDD